MRNLLIIATLLFSSATHANGPTAEQCKIVAQISKKVMEIRQGGISMIDAMDAMEGNKLGIMLVKDAYSTPSYKTESFKQNAINEFSNKYTAMCFKLVK